MGEFSEAEAREIIDGARLHELQGRRDEMIEWCITERKFTRSGATRLVDNFLTTMRYCLDETGALPR